MQKWYSVAFIYNFGASIKLTVRDFWSYFDACQCMQRKFNISAAGQKSDEPKYALLSFCCFLLLMHRRAGTFMKVGTRGANKAPPPRTWCRMSRRWCPGRGCPQRTNDLGTVPAASTKAIMTKIWHKEFNCTLTWLVWVERNQTGAQYFAAE